MTYAAARATYRDNARPPNTMAYDDETTYDSRPPPDALVSPGLQKRLALRRQRAAADATKPPSSGWLLELETLEQLLTCPMPADSWWSPSDFRRYLHALGPDGPSPLPSVALIARALNKAQVFGVSSQKTNEGLLRYRVRP